MEKIIHFTVPKTISAAQSEVIDCARKFHPSWDIKVWQDPIRPDGYLLEKYWSKVKSGASFADLFRLDVLYKFGGVYVDSDLKLLKPLDDLLERFDFFIASENGYHLTNALIGARRKSPVLLHLINQLCNAEPDWNLPPDITTGPRFFAQHLKWRKDITVLPRESFYTYIGKTNLSKTNHRHSYGEHLWEASWVAAYHARKNVIQRVRAYLVESIKSYIKKNVILGFGMWHRLKAHDEMKHNCCSYQCSDQLVVQTIHGFKILADGTDLSVTPELVFKGFYELPVEKFLKNTLKGGDWVIDVGSNIGSFSLLAAQNIGPFGRVFSFEPNPRPAGLMAKSLVMNWMHERVYQRQVAVADRSGTVNLTFVPECLGGAQVNENEVTRSTANENLKTIGTERAIVLAVSCVRLDDEFPVDLPIKVLKIDVEGYEGHVLAGAKRLLERRCIDFVVMELLEEIAGSRWREIVDQVKKVISYGYTVSTLTNEGTLVKQKDLATAIAIGDRNIVLVAQEQYMPA